MARSRKSSIELTAYDDLFQTDESRAEAALSKIRDIPISEIDEFPDHPFKVLMDEDMEQLVDSIKRNGVMTPATVRLKEDGRYELISGHRRKKACELAGLDTLKCEVKEFSRDEAIIVMVESNLQRTTILPSEKAFAYKMRLEAMNRQGKRTDLTCSPMGNKLQGNLDCFEFYPGVKDEEELGRMYILEFEALTVPEHLIDYIDYEAYGRDVRINEGGHFAPGGYVFDNQSKFIEHYTGLDDIPEEYRISNVHARDEKEETRSILETIKQFKEAPPVPHKDKAGPSHEGR